MNLRAAHKLMIYAATIGTALATDVITFAMSKQEAVAPRRIDPAALRKVGQVDPRFLAYNVESVEVTGGNFWAPIPDPARRHPRPWKVRMALASPPGRTGTASPST